MLEKSTINSIIDYCNQHDSVYCYGAGKYGKIIRTYLAEQGLELAGFIITTYNVNNSRVLGLEVCSVDNYAQSVFGNKGVIVGVCESNQGEIIDILDKYGIRDYCCVNEEVIREIEQQCSYSCRYQTKNNVTVFCYHRVTDNPLDTWRLSVSPTLFDKQIKYIKDNYHLLRSEEDWTSACDQRAAVITFDDGYEDFYTNAVPILERNCVPATVFVCTDNINTDQEFWWDEIERIIYFADSKMKSFFAFDNEIKLINNRDKEKACYYLHPYLKKMKHNDRKEFLKDFEKELGSYSRRDYCRSMSIEQLREVSKSKYITVGGHTVTHSCLAAETLEEQKNEIRDSKGIIESIINRSLDVFSYPFGQLEDFTSQTTRIAQECGYSKIFAAFPGIASPKCINGSIPRINIGQAKDYSESIRLLRRYETMYGDV